MKTLIFSLIILIMPVIVIAQEPQNLQQDQQNVVVNNSDRTLKFINIAPKPGGFLYVINGATNYTIPESVGLDQYNFICRKNCSLSDIYLPVKLLRQVFTIDELTTLQNNNADKDGYIQIELTLNSKGRIIDMALIKMHFDDADIIKIFTPARVKQLYIKLRDNLQYQMPALDSSITQYIRNYFVYFKDVLLGKPMLCTNAPRQLK